MITQIIHAEEQGQHYVLNCGEHDLEFNRFTASVGARYMSGWGVYVVPPERMNELRAACLRLNIQILEQST